VRILIASSPKTGNVWLKYLLMFIYNIQEAQPRNSSLDNMGWLGSIESFVSVQHWNPTKKVLDWVKENDVIVCTTTRHPGDEFVSLYYYVNRMYPLWDQSGWPRPRKEMPSAVMIGEEIDSPTTLKFLKEGFGKHITKSVEWLLTGKSHIVQYEALKDAPLQTLYNLCQSIEPAAIGTIKRAIEQSTIEKQRGRGNHLRIHCRSGEKNQWKTELSDVHIEIFKELYSKELSCLGYAF